MAALKVGPPQRRTADYYGNCPALCRGHGFMPHEAMRGYNILSTYKGTAREKEGRPRTIPHYGKRKRYVSFTTLPVRVTHV